MPPYSLNVLAEAIHQRVDDLAAPKNRLYVASHPQPFVAPPLSKLVGPLSSEVVLIVAPAAVGKSTSAHWLSASLRAPLLDLSRVGVSTGTLEALLGALPHLDPKGEFHAGRLPIIIDALDEGWLRSNSGFDDFFSTVAEFLGTDRTVTTTPKLVLLGRPEHVSLAELALSEGFSDLTICRAELDFFDHDSAFELVEAFAARDAEDSSAFNKHRDRAREAIEVYFSAIAATLGLAPDQLWTDQRGKAFAGYAPVLAALGAVLAIREVNYQKLINRLTLDEGRGEAWQVIMTVMDVIMEREREEKIGYQLQEQGISVTSDVYDCDQQLSLLLSHLQGETPAPSAPSLAPHDRAKYFGMVQTLLPEHPFVRDGRATNPVFGAVILAHGVAHGLLNDRGTELVEHASRQPFLWRSFMKHAGEDLVDGKHVGALITSWSNDPNTLPKDICLVDEEDDGSLSVMVGDGANPALRFLATDPVRLLTRMSNTLLFLPNSSVELASEGAFEFLGSSSVVCRSLHVRPEAIMVSGPLFVEAAFVTCEGTFNIRTTDGGVLLCFGPLSTTYPWSAIRYNTPKLGTNLILIDLVRQCMTRLPGTLVLQPDLHVTDDWRVNWIRRDFPTAFPVLMKLLTEEGCADIENVTAGGALKKRVRLNFRWHDLFKELQFPTDDGPLNTIAAKATSLIDSY